MKFQAWITGLVAALLLALGSVYVVREGQAAIVLNLGKMVRTNVGPGLHFKMPLIESVRVFDRRFYASAFSPERSLTSERKDVSVDFIAIGYIEDVSAFYRATGGDEAQATSRLEPIIKNALRNEINARTLTQLVSGARSGMIDSQLPGINQAVKSLGVKIVDIRFKQIELPTDSEVIGQVYERMRAERHQVASKLRAEGEEQARAIRGQADRDQQVVLAEAERDAQKLRGEGDAQATRIYADAANRDPSFFAFQRSLDAYRRAFDGGDGVIVLDRDDPFLQYLRSDR